MGVDVIGIVFFQMEVFFARGCHKAVCDPEVGYANKLVKLTQDKKNNLSLMTGLLEDSREWCQMGLVPAAVGAAQPLSRALYQIQAHILEEALCSFHLLLHLRERLSQRLIVN